MDLAQTLSISGKLKQLSGLQFLIYENIKIKYSIAPSKGCLEVISFHHLKWPLGEGLAHGRQRVKLVVHPFCTNLN